MRTFLPNDKYANISTPLYCLIVDNEYKVGWKVCQPWGDMKEKAEGEKFANHGVMWKKKLRPSRWCWEKGEGLNWGRWTLLLSTSSEQLSCLVTGQWATKVPAYLGANASVTKGWLKSLNGWSRWSHPSYSHKPWLNLNMAWVGWHGCQIAEKIFYQFTLASRAMPIKCVQFMGKEAQDGGDIYIYTYIFIFVYIIMVDSSYCMAEH